MPERGGGADRTATGCKERLTASELDNDGGASGQEDASGLRERVLPIWRVPRPRRRRRFDLLIRGIRQSRIKRLRRRRACLRIASTFAANAAGSMIGVPRHGDIDSRSVSLETMSSAPTSAARSRIRLSWWSEQS